MIKSTLLGIFRLNVHVVLILATLLACAPAEPDPGEKLRDILKRRTEFLSNEFPSLGTTYDRLPSMTEEAIKRRAGFAQDIIDELEALDKNAMAFNDVITYELLRFVSENTVEQYRLKGYLNPILVDDGFHISFAFLPKSYAFNNQADYENYIKILKAFPLYVQEHIALMTRGLETGMAQPKVILKGYEVTFDKHIVDHPEQSLFYEPFQNIKLDLPESEKESLMEAGKAAVLEGAVQGYKNFSVFMKERFMPETRESTGAYDLPEGKDFYQQRIRYFTTLDLTPDSIHNLGLSEVARIRDEMIQVIEGVGFKGSFKDFLKFLRTDERFYAKTPDELLKEAAYISKSMDGKLPALFGKLPRQPYTVNPVPDHLAPKYTGGRYVPASPESNNPGQYWVNTYALENRPLYVLEALSFHEAVPGHHLQGALTSELTHLPKFRQQLYLSAFGEGWGLYSEFLGLEAGFYKDPYSNFGRLTYEMWRACRLVVDTGLHAKGWSREKAMQYMAEHTALSLHEVRTETDRYISWPGQALSYKIGELKIKALRTQAEQALGQHFDIREFHDLILSQGTVTLALLEKMVDRYITEKQAS